MKIISVRPSKRFRYHWEADDGEGTQPTFAGKRDALDYARSRFGGITGEIHIYSQDGSSVEEKIIVETGSSNSTS